MPTSRGVPPWVLLLSGALAVLALAIAGSVWMVPPGAGVRGVWLAGLLFLAAAVGGGVSWLAARRLEPEPTEGSADDVELVYAEGVGRLLAGELAAARATFDRVLARNPDHVSALLSLGEVLRREGDLGEAERLHRRASLLHPEDVDVLRQLALDAEAGGRWSDARAILRQIRQQARDSLWVLERLRDLGVAEGDWAAAAEAQQEWLRARGIEDPAHPEQRRWVGLHYAAGCARLAAGHVREAAATFREVIRRDRSFVPAYVGLGDAYVKLGSHGRPSRLWERAYAVTGAGVILARLERFYLAQERPHRLIGFYRTAILKRPHDLVLRFHLARLYLRLEMLEEARAELEGLLREVPTYGPALIHLAEIADRQGRSEEALALYRRAVEGGEEALRPARCQACGAAAPEWTDRCAGCGRWNTMQDTLRLTPEGPPQPVSASAASEISQIGADW